MAELNEFEIDDDFPIPRVRCIADAKPAIVPEYKPNVHPMNTQLFQLFYSVANFHIPQYDLLKCQIHDHGLTFSPALEAVGFSFDLGDDTDMLRSQIIRKYLIELHYLFLRFTNSNSLFSIASLHNELELTYDYLKEQQGDTELIEYCALLLAETYDLYGSVITGMINNDYWSKEQSAEDLIKNLLQPEVEKLRTLNVKSVEILQDTIVKRAKERAPPTQIAALNQWARDLYKE